MVLIKLSAHHKIVAIVTVILMAVNSMAFATGATKSDVQNMSLKESVKNTAILVTQSYAPETRDECIKAITTNSNFTSEPIKTPKNNETVDKSKTESKSKGVEETVYIQYYAKQDAIDIAKVLYNECRGVPSITEQACVAWTILNRVDNSNSTVYSVVRAPRQFAFRENTPVWDNLLNLAYDVLDRWSREKSGETNVGRVLPKKYMYFEGYNGHNYFRDKYSGSYNTWDYSLPSPYKN